MLTTLPADRELDLDSAAPLSGIYWAERTEVRWSPTLQSYCLVLHLQCATGAFLAIYPSQEVARLHALRAGHYFRIEGVHYRYRDRQAAVFCRVLQIAPHGPTPREWLQCMPWSHVGSRELRQRFRVAFRRIESPLLRQFLMLEMSNASIARQLWCDIPDGAVAALGYAFPGGRLAAGLELAETQRRMENDVARVDGACAGALLWFVHFADHQSRHGWRMLKTVWPAAAEELARRQPSLS